MLVVLSYWTILPRFNCEFSPVANYTFSYNNLVFNQENNFYLLSLTSLITWLVDVIGRSYMLITFGS